MIEMKKIPKKVVIVIVNWNGKSLLRRCLDSIEKNTIYPSFETIVVDNGSTDGSVEMVEREFPNVQLIRNKENLGFAIANNQGIKRSLEHGASYVLLLNNDTEIIQKGWLKRMVETMGEYRHTGLLGPKVLRPDRMEYYSAGWMSPVEERTIPKGLRKPRKVGVVSFCAILIRREVIENIGLLDEGFSPFLWEDQDYYARTRKAGYRIVYEPRVAIVHYGSMSLKKVDEDFNFFNCRKNRIRFVLLNFPLTWIPLGIAVVLLSVVLKKKNPETRLTLTNITLRSGITRKFGLFLRAWKLNLKNLGEIIKKRRNRIAKIWY